MVTGDFMPKSLAALPADITIGLDEPTNGLWSGRSYGNACVLGWRGLSAMEESAYGQSIHLLWLP